MRRNQCVLKGAQELHHTASRRRQWGLVSALAISIRRIRGPHRKCTDGKLLTPMAKAPIGILGAPASEFDK